MVLTLVGGVSPPSDTLAVLSETLVTFYVAPGTAEDRFSSLYAIPLRRVQLGSTTAVDLTGELSPDQLEYLKAGTLHVGPVFSETEVSISNSEASPVSFEGLSWELTSLRIRGTATFSL